MDLQGHEFHYQLNRLVDRVNQQSDLLNRLIQLLEIPSLQETRRSHGTTSSPHTPELP